MSTIGGFTPDPITSLMQSPTASAPSATMEEMLAALSQNNASPEQSQLGQHQLALGQALMPKPEGTQMAGRVAIRNSPLSIATDGLRGYLGAQKIGEGLKSQQDAAAQEAAARSAVQAYMAQQLRGQQEGSNPFQLGSVGAPTGDMSMQYPNFPAPAQAAAASAPPAETGHPAGAGGYGLYQSSPALDMHSVDPHDNAAWLQAWNQQQ